MIEITERPILDSEIKILAARIPGTWKRIETSTLKFIFILFVFLAPMLLIDKYWFHVSSRAQAIALVPMLLFSAALSYWLDKKFNDLKDVKSDIESGLVTVYDVKSDRVIKRKDPDDFGPMYYFDLGQGSEYKTLVLFGQYLMGFKKKKFPSTEFKVVKGKSGQVIIVIPGGEALKPVKILEPYADDYFKKGNVPNDGDLLLISIDEITK